MEKSRSEYMQGLWIVNQQLVAAVCAVLEIERVVVVVKLMFQQCHYYVYNCGRGGWRAHRQRDECVFFVVIIHPSSTRSCGADSQRIFAAAACCLDFIIKHVC